MRPQDLPLTTKLIQLAEETAELNQACLKLLRVFRAETPVSMADAKMHLLEEIADVLLCCDIITSSSDDQIIKGIMLAKEKRWEERLAEHSTDIEATLKMMEEAHD